MRYKTISFQRIPAFFVAGAGFEPATSTGYEPGMLTSALSRMWHKDTAKIRGLRRKFTKNQKNLQKFRVD